MTKHIYIHLQRTRDASPLERARQALNDLVEKENKLSTQIEKKQDQGVTVEYLQRDLSSLQRQIKVAAEAVKKLESSGGSRDAARIVQQETRGNLRAKIYYDPEYQEFVVKFFDGGRYLGDAKDYFTNDKDDAVGTARAELQRMSGAAA